MHSDFPPWPSVFLANAIDQCLIISSLLSLKPSAQPLFTYLHNILLKQIRFFISVLQQMARAYPMIALSLVVARFMQRRMEARLAGINLKSNTLTLPSARTVITKATKRRSLVFDPDSFLS